MALIYLNASKNRRIKILHLDPYHICIFIYENVTRTNTSTLWSTLAFATWLMRLRDRIWGLISRQRRSWKTVDALDKTMTYRRILNATSRNSVTHDAPFSTIYVVVWRRQRRRILEDHWGQLLGRSLMSGKFIAAI